MAMATATVRWSAARRATKLTMMATMTTVATDDDEVNGDGATYPILLQWATTTATSMATARRATKTTMMAAVDQ